MEHGNETLCRFACRHIVPASQFSMRSAFAQDTETEPTISEIFASLPQSRTEDGGFVVGKPEAPITIVEFVDYACPHCQTYRPVAR